MTNVEEKVNLPGIALLVVGVLAILGNIGSLIWQGLTAIPAMMSLFEYGTSADWIAFAMGQGWGLAMTFIGIFMAFVVVFAGVKMRQLSGAGIVYAGAVIAMLPCCGVGVPCCCLGLPIGIWAIVTMQDEEVKSAFAG
jgi:hypothetical protein